MQVWQSRDLLACDVCMLLLLGQAPILVCMRMLLSACQWSAMILMTVEVLIIISVVFDSVSFLSLLCYVVFCWCVCARALFSVNNLFQDILAPVLIKSCNLYHSPV